VIILYIALNLSYIIYKIIILPLYIIIYFYINICEFEIHSLYEILTIEETNSLVKDIKTGYTEIVHPSRFYGNKEKFKSIHRRETLNKLLNEDREY